MDGKKKVKEKHRIDRQVIWAVLVVLWNHDVTLVTMYSLLEDFPNKYHYVVVIKYSKDVLWLQMEKFSCILLTFVKQ